MAMKLNHLIKLYAYHRSGDCFVALRAPRNDNIGNADRSPETVIASEAKQSRVDLLRYVVAFVLASLAIPAHAQDYPTRPIPIVSAQASGGASDTVTRAIQDRLQTALGQPIVMENRPGASGNVGAAQVARAAPDGYTLMIGTDAMMTSNVHLFKSMPFDPAKDFAPITY